MSRVTLVRDITLDQPYNLFTAIYKQDLINQESKTRKLSEIGKEISSLVNFILGPTILHTEGNGYTTKQRHIVIGCSNYYQLYYLELGNEDIFWDLASVKKALNISNNPNFSDHLYLYSTWRNPNHANGTGSIIHRGKGGRGYRKENLLDLNEYCGYFKKDHWQFLIRNKKLELEYGGDRKKIGVYRYADVFFGRAGETAIGFRTTIPLLYISNIEEEFILNV